MRSNLNAFMVNTNLMNEIPILRVGQVMTVNHLHSVEYRYFIPEGHNMKEVTEETFKEMRGRV